MEEIPEGSEIEFVGALERVIGGALRHDVAYKVICIPGVAPSFRMWADAAADSPKQAASREYRCTYRKPAPAKDGRHGCQGLPGRRLGCAWRDHI